MRVAALILAILGGLSGLSFAAYANVALFIFGAVGMSPDAVGLAKLLIFGLPIASFIGGGLTLSKPGPSGAILITAALGYLIIAGWLQTNFFTIATMLLIGTAGVLALLTLGNTEAAPLLSPNPSTPVVYPGSPATNTAPNFDRVKWNALVKYDPQIDQIAEKLRGLGDKWIDVFAADYLALEDKQYLPEIVRKIIADAKAEAEELERLSREKEVAVQREAHEQWQRAEQQRAEKERIREARRARMNRLKEQAWGTPLRKTTSIAIVLLITIGGPIAVYSYQQHVESLAAAQRAADQKEAEERLNRQLTEDKRRREEERRLAAIREEEERPKREAAARLAIIVAQSKQNTKVIWERNWGPVANYRIVLTDTNIQFGHTAMVFSSISWPSENIWFGDIQKFERNESSVVLVLRTRRVTVETTGTTEALDLMSNLYAATKAWREKYSAIFVPTPAASSSELNFVKLPEYPFAFAKDHPVAFKTFHETVPRKFQTVDWISFLSATSGPLVKVLIEGKSYLGASICKSHDCADNRMSFLVTDDGSRAVLGIKTSDTAGQVQYFGTPTAWEITALRQLDEGRY
jgi:hypothetical protein